MLWRFLTMSLQDENLMDFPSQELNDFDMMVREVGASTHDLPAPTGRYIQLLIYIKTF